jgi:hypothetical protein
LDCGGFQHRFPFPPPQSAGEPDALQTLRESLTRACNFLILQKPRLLPPGFDANVFPVSTATEIEIAIRQLPAAEARKLAPWLQNYLAGEVAPAAPPAREAFAKWRGRGRLPVGRTTDDYLRLTRDGNGRCHRGSP